METALFAMSVALGTAMIVGLLADRIPAFERRVTVWFSGLTTHPRWFMAWAFAAVLWVVVRTFLVSDHIRWFTGDDDFIVLTILWSVVPFLVENSLKASQAEQMRIQAEQMQTLTDLTLAIRQELDQSEERDQAAALRDDSLLFLANKILDMLERRKGVKR